MQIIESRLTRLSYAPGDRTGHARASSRPARIVGARQRMIVEGAVGMVQLALQRLEEEGVVELDEERKAAIGLPTCSSCSAASRPLSRSSTPAPCTSDGGRGYHGERT